MKIAIVGATGAVGSHMLQDLEDLTDFSGKLTLFASRASKGKTRVFRGKTYTVEEFCPDRFGSYDFVLMSAGTSFSKQYSEKLAEKGCVVIDNSSAWRQKDHIPLVVPEVNGHLLSSCRQGIISNPNCVVIPLVTALKPLQENFGFDLVQVATYQSVSGAGAKGVFELKQQEKALVKQESLSPKVFPWQILQA